MSVSCVFGFPCIGAAELISFDAISPLPLALTLWCDDLLELRLLAPWSSGSQCACGLLNPRPWLLSPAHFFQACHRHIVGPCRTQPQVRYARCLIIVLVRVGVPFRVCPCILCFCPFTLCMLTFTITVFVHVYGLGGSGCWGQRRMVKPSVVALCGSTTKRTGWLQSPSLLFCCLPALVAHVFMPAPPLPLPFLCCFRDAARALRGGIGSVERGRHHVRVAYW